MARPKAFDREKALKKAEEVFRTKGFNGSSTEDLRLAMGIGRQSFYDSFGDKKTLYLEVLQNYNIAQSSGYVELLRKAKNPVDALTNLLLTVAQQSPQEASLGCLGIDSICEFEVNEQAIHSLGQETHGVLISLITQVVHESRAHMQLKPQFNDQAIANFLMVVLSGLKIAAKAGATPDHLREMAHIAIASLKLP